MSRPRITSEQARVVLDALRDRLARIDDVASVMARLNLPADEQAAKALHGFRHQSILLRGTIAVFERVVASSPADCLILVSDTYPAAAI